MNRNVNKVSVIGSGIMGSGIACHFANIGIEVLLLDIAPKEINEHEKKSGLTINDSAVKNRIVKEMFNRCLKSKPSPLYHKSYANRVTLGNIEDNMKDISDSDWIIEVVTEKIEIKKLVFEQV